MTMLTTIKDTTIEIKTITADFHLSNTEPTLGLGGGFAASGLIIRSVTFKPSAANDVLVIKNSPDGDENDPAEIYWKCADSYDQRVKTYGDRGRRWWPFIDFSECTFSQASLASVIFELA